MTPPDSLAPRAATAAGVMTVRGLFIRIASAGGGLLILTLVSPSEFGMLAIVRSVTGAIEQATELGLVWPLLSQREDPSPEDYAALAGTQLLILLAVLCGAVLLYNLDKPWRAWLLILIVSMLIIPLGTGARVRLERQFRYPRIAFAEVSAVLLHTVVLIGFLLASRFTIGVFVAQIAITLYINTLLFVSSPGPLPTWQVGRLARRVKSSFGYTVAYLVFAAREQAPPLIVAALFDLRVAGMWAFAVRLAKFLQFAQEGYARVAVPAAARLAPDRVGLRELARRSLKGSAIIAIPLAAVVVLGLPGVARFWPQWAPAIPLAQVYVGCDAIAGVAATAFAPIALALRGWRAVLIEHALPLSVACAGFLLCWRTGWSNLQGVVVSFHLAAIAALFFVTEPEVRRFGR